MRMIFCALVGSLLISMAFAAPEKPIAVDIQAERVEIDQKLGRVLFSGGVRVSRGALVLACERLVARYEKNGVLIALTMRGRLTVHGKEFSAQAGYGEYDHKAGRLVLTGQPQVKRGPHHMTGDRIVVFVDEERVVVERARGRVSVPIEHRGSQ